MSFVVVGKLEHLDTEITDKALKQDPDVQLSERTQELMGITDVQVYS